MKLTYLILSLFLSLSLFAHGVSYVEVHNGYGVQVEYENGDALEFGDVTVFRPGETVVEFQLGMTDENGVFMFKPDTNGMWTLKISDGLGHGRVIQVNIDDTKPDSLEGTRRPHPLTAVSAIGYILFIFSIWYFIRMRKK